MTKARKPRTRTQATVIGRGSNIQVIDRLARMLELFAVNGREMKVREVATPLHLRRSTAHRYLASLSRAGLLRTEGDGLYTLGALLIQLGAAAVGGVQIGSTSPKTISVNWQTKPRKQRCSAYGQVIVRW